MKGETDARVEMPSEIKILGMAESQTEFREQLAQGARLLHAGKMDEALPHLLRARELEPQNADAALNLSGAYLMSGRFKLALPILEEAVAHSPGNARLWINLGAAQLGNPITATDERQKKRWRHLTAPWSWTQPRPAWPTTWGLFTATAANASRPSPPFAAPHKATPATRMRKVCWKSWRK